MTEYKSKYREDDVALLLPSFQPVVRQVVAKLQGLGFEPVVFDTLRTPEEAARNAAKGTGIVDSVHLYGAACDIICNKHGWACKAKSCKFYIALRRIAIAEGAFIGPESDWPHFQAVPVGYWQNRLRACGIGPDKAAARDAVVLASRARPKR